jgi:hypothetical protein
VAGALTRHADDVLAQMIQTERKAATAFDVAFGYTEVLAREKPKRS